MNKKFIGFCAAAMACTNLALGQEKATVQKLDEVVVSDSRFELKRENSGKTVIKINSEEIKKSQGKTVAEIINSKSGISIAGSNGRDGAVLGVYARGGRGRQVLVLIDGIRVSDPSSFSQEYDLRLLSTASIASIEIIKGAASTLYGTNAATAVINITTKGASEDKINGNFQSSIGTNHTTDDQNYNISDFSNSALIDGSLSKFTYKVGVSNSYSDGLSAIVTPTNEKDDFSNFSLDVNLGYHFSNNFRINVYGNQTKVNTAFDESFGMFDAPYLFLSEQKRAGLFTNLKYTNGEIVLHTAISDFESENKTAFPSVFAGKNLVADIYNKYNFNNTFYTVLGVNYIKDETEFTETKDFTILDPYANAVYISPFGLNVNAGFRLNNHSEYGSHFVYNINPSFNFFIDEGYIKLMASYATSYITPTMNHLFGNFGANPDLEPEDDATIEGGVEFSNSNDLRISALYFSRKEENFVFYGANGYENATNTINANGVEVELDWKPVKKLSFSGNYTFTNRKGDNAIRIPKHKINATLGYDFSDETYTSLNYAMIGKRTDTDFGSFPSVDVGLDGYSLLDFYLSHEICPNKLTVFLNVSNLLNIDYEEVLGFTTKGRNVRIGFSLNL